MESSSSSRRFGGFEFSGVDKSRQSPSCRGDGEAGEVRDLGGGHAPASTRPIGNQRKLCFGRGIEGAEAADSRPGVIAETVRGWLSRGRSGDP